MTPDPRLRCDKLFRLFASWAGDALVVRTIELAGDTTVTPTQFRCLAFVAGRRRCTVGELAEGLAVSDAAATKLVDRLQGKGLVARATHRADRRVVHVRLNDVGLSLIVRLARKRDRLLDDAIARLSRRRLDTLTDGIESVLLSALDSPLIIRRICLHCGDDHSADCVINRAHIRITGVELSWR